MASGDPPRLIDDPSVPAELRSVLTRAAQHVPPVDTAAGLAELQAKIQASAAASGGGGVAALAIAAAVAIGGAMWVATRGGDEPGGVEPPSFERAMSASEAGGGALTEETPGAAAGLEALLDRPDAERDGLEHASAGGPVSAGESAPPATARESAAPSELARTPVATSARRRAEPRGGEGGDADTLARDMAKLAAARRALADDPARALALVEAGRREFPSSIFGEEREALRVLALAELGRDAEARRLGSAFLAAHPSSPFAERVRRAIERSR